MSINPSANLTRLLSEDRIREVENSFGKSAGAAAKAAADAVVAAGLVVTRRRPAHFVVLIEDGRIDAVLAQSGKLGQVLEKRGSISVNYAMRGSSDGLAPMTASPALKAVDPYDVVIAMPAEDGEPAVSDADRDAWQKWRATYSAVIEVPPYTVTGTLLLLPSQDPMSLGERGADLFLAVFNPTVEWNGAVIRDIPRDSILVNRTCIRRIKATMTA